MKFLIDNWLLITVALSSGALLMWPAITGGARAGSVSANDAVNLMNREKAVVIDVCEASEYATGHVIGAKSIPLAELESRLPTAVKNKSLPLILVCASGMRSSRAVAIATKLGYEKTVSLSGGMRAWREANLPIEKA